MKIQFSVILTVVILFSAISSKNSYSQYNPLYADKLPVSVNEHWMFAGYDDSVSGVWSNGTPLQQSLYGVNSFYWEGNGKVFVCGGSTQDGTPQSACWWYDPASDSYEPAASLPQGRWSGKLVKVQDSLYLIGSIDSTFTSADGLTFRYSLTQNNWVQKATMPIPYVQESASALYNDTTIVVVGGSTSAFINAVNFVRLYNPVSDTWRSLSGSSLFPLNSTSAHAECLKTDSANSIFVLGGYAGGPLNTVYRGRFLFTGDTASIAWSLFDTLNAGLFGQPVYRVAGSKWNETALFGPALNGAVSVNAVWGLKFYNDTDYVWTKFEPGSPDTVANISTFASKSGVDTNYFYMFGGFKNPNVVSTVQKYTFATPPPPPIGINIVSGNIPQAYKLYQNYPNPFNPSTKIKFSVPTSKNQTVKLTVYDIIGREISVLVNEELKAGTYEVQFNAANLSSGIYFYVMRAGNNSITNSMVLVK